VASETLDAFEYTHQAPVLVHRSVKRTTNFEPTDFDGLGPSGNDLAPDPHDQRCQYTTDRDQSDHR
jgi:hypothetical protein